MDITNIGGALLGQQAQRQVHSRTPVASHVDEEEDPVLPDPTLPATQISSNEIVVDGHRIRTGSNTSASTFKKQAWSIDKFSEQAQQAAEDGTSMDGILYPGEVDEAQQAFLKNTTFVE